MTDKKPEDIIHQSICDDLCQCDVNLVDHAGKVLIGDEGHEFITALIETALHQLNEADFKIIKIKRIEPAPSKSNIADWDEAPEWANFFMMDFDGLWYWSKENVKPSEDPQYPHWINADDNRGLMREWYVAVYDRFDGDWKDSLQERPMGTREEDQDIELAVQ